MITKDEILAELENTPEPEKKLHEIADRENQPVMVIRKILRDQIIVVPACRKPEPEPEPYARAGHRHKWTEEEIAHAEASWRRGASMQEIADSLFVSVITIKGLVRRFRDRFPQRHNAAPIWSEEEISHAADLWRDSTLTVYEICEKLHRNHNDFYQLRVENPYIFPPRKTWTRRKP